MWLCIFSLGKGDGEASACCRCVPIRKSFPAKRMDISNPCDRVPTLTTTTAFLSHHQTPWKECINPLLEAHKFGVNFGEAHFGSVAALSAVEVAICAVLPLQEIRDIFERTHSDVEKLDGQILFHVSSYVNNLCLISGVAMDEELRMLHVESGNAYTC